MLRDVDGSGEAVTDVDSIVEKSVTSCFGSGVGERVDSGVGDSVGSLIFLSLVTEIYKKL